MIARTLLAALLATAVATGAAAQDGAPEAVVDAPGANPIIRDTFTADPAPLVAGDRVYLYVGRDASTNEKYNMPDWLLYSSADMRHWEPHGVVLKPTDFAWSTGEAYASQVVEKDGRFYFFSTSKDRASKAMAIGVAVADQPTGPFTDARGTPLVTNAMTPQGTHDWSDIDPTVLTDAEGTSWLMWGNGNCFLAQLSPDMTELAGPIEEVELPFYEEGPWLHRRGELYYLTYASWDHDQHDAEHISYATAPSVRGPWTYRGELTGAAANSSTIHPGIIEFGGQSHFFYHDGSWAIDGVAGGGSRRNVRVEPLHYDADGTIRPIALTAAGVTAEQGEERP